MVPILFNFCFLLEYLFLITRENDRVLSGEVLAPCCFLFTGRHVFRAED